MLGDAAAKDKVLQSMAAMSSAQIVSASAIHNKAVAQGLAGLTPSMGPAYPPYGSQVRDVSRPHGLVFLYTLGNELLSGSFPSPYW